MKRNIVFLAVMAALIMPAIVSCGPAKERLYLYNWAVYTPDSVIKKFEKEYNAKVFIDEFEANEEMYAKLTSGGSGWDIVFPSGDYVEIMINQGMFERIDHSKMENLGNIDPAVLKRTMYDPTMEYSVPYYFGAAGVLINTARVSEFEESWNIFSRSDLRGRMTMLDDMREVVGAALSTLGYSVNTKNPAELNEAHDLIMNSWKPNLAKFDAVAFGKQYASGDFWVVHGYPEVVYEEIIDDPDLMKNTYFFIPREGGSAYIDSMCILKGAKNIDLAHKFIDFIHRPEIYAEFAEALWFPATANIPAREIKTGWEMYSIEDLEDTELKDDLGLELELYNEIWFNSIRVD